MNQLHMLDFIMALVLVCDVVTGHLLSARQLKLAEQMPEPRDRELMRERARRSRTMLTRVSPALLALLYVLWLRPSAVGG